MFAFNQVCAVIRTKFPERWLLGLIKATAKYTKYPITNIDAYGRLEPLCRISNILCKCWLSSPERRELLQVADTIPRLTGPFPPALLSNNKEGRLAAKCRFKKKKSLRGPLLFDPSVHQKSPRFRYQTSESDSSKAHLSVPHITIKFILHHFSSATENTSVQNTGSLYVTVISSYFCSTFQFSPSVVSSSRQTVPSCQVTLAFPHYGILLVRVMSIFSFFSDDALQILLPGTRYPYIPSSILSRTFPGSTANITFGILLPPAPTLSSSFSTSTQDYAACTPEKRSRMRQKSDVANSRDPFRVLPECHCRCPQNLLSVPREKALLVVKLVLRYSKIACGLL